MSLRIHDGEAAQSHRIAVIKSRLPKITTGCRIKTFIPTEDMNAENIRILKSNPNMLSQVSLK